MTARTYTSDDGVEFAICPRCGIHQLTGEAGAAGECLPDCEARAIRAGGLFRVTHKGVEVFRGSESGALGHVLKAQGQSYEYARQYAGWLIERAN